jgi:peroxiredoxin
MALTFSPQDELGLPCPDFSLPGVDEHVHSLAEYKNGKPLVVMFICNHCPYVKAVEDRLIELGRELKAMDVNVVAICSNDADEYSEDSFENMQKRAKEKNYPFPYLHDETQEIAEEFGAVCTPDFFVYDAGLRCAYRGRLDDSWKDPSKVTRRELFTAVQLLLQGKPAPKEQTPAMGCNIKWRDA